MLNMKETTETLAMIDLEKPKMEWHSSVRDDRQSHLWYGGEIVTLTTSGYKFHLEALGDVRARLYQRSSNGGYSEDSLLEDILDKRNQGMFGFILSDYIENDEELEQLLNDDHPTYYLELTNNNWWECFITDPDGNWHDLMWNLDAVGIKESIVEIFSALNHGVDFSDNRVLRFKNPMLLAAHSSTY